VAAAVVVEAAAVAAGDDANIRAKNFGFRERRLKLFQRRSVCSGIR